MIRGEHRAMPSSNFYDRRHPEQQAGEVYLCNATREDANRLRWKTKRAGDEPFDVNGNSIIGETDLFPIFVQKEELEDAGVIGRTLH